MSRNKKILILFLIFVCVFVIGRVFYSKTEKGELVVGGKTFSVEIADNAITLERGLSLHPPIRDDEGMFFIFPKPYNYGFWMKEMLFPLDIVWIDPDFRIIYIEHSLATSTYPQSFFPNGQALYVLEVNAGQMDALGVKIGDTVNFIKK